jgi:hypothetical protein
MYVIFVHLTTKRPCPFYRHSGRSTSSCHRESPYYLSRAPCHVPIATGTEALNVVLRLRFMSLFGSGVSYTKQELWLNPLVQQSGTLSDSLLVEGKFLMKHMKWRSCGVWRIVVPRILTLGVRQSLSTNNPYTLSSKLYLYYEGKRVKPGNLHKAATLFLNFGTKCRWAVSLTSQLLCPYKKTPRHPFYMRHLAPKPTWTF